TSWTISSATARLPTIMVAAAVSPRCSCSTSARNPASPVSSSFIRSSPSPCTHARAVDPVAPSSDPKVFCLIRRGPTASGSRRCPARARGYPRTMARPRFRYSPWDGTQQGFELDALDLMEQLTDDLLYHG